MSAPASFADFHAQLVRLVERFDRQHPTFTSPDYNEATLRADFLDPFFRALGWDVGNTKGLIHTEREVDIEVRTTTSGRQTRADYVFRIDRVDRFTCEAKKPAEVLHDRHIFQAKRDAFNRGIPLALLSDFEELKIYIVGARPVFAEPHTGELKVFHFRQYPDVARELWDLLAYENVAAGSIDRRIDELPKRPLKLKGKQGWLIKPDRARALDSDFLNFLDGVRQQLGSDLLKHNDRDDLLQGHRLNEAAQRIIDRLVFLRICEDRGIDTGTLLESLFSHWFRQQPEGQQPRLRKVSHQTNLRFGGGAVEEEPAAHSARHPGEGGLYREFVDHVRALDQRPPSYKPFFNGQLFKPHFSEDLVVGDEWLANFILDLTSDDSGYNFADIKVEILGDAYERFLGHILVPRGRGTAIEKRPELRKDAGVYYTPRYITDHIVEQTIGRLLARKTPKQVEKLRFLDPACGSGSFLICAYERVMKHYLLHYTTLAAELAARPENAGKSRADLLARHKDDCFVDAADNVRLTTALKRQILRNNIYGVDLDAQAVEVTQLSLYLKMLEDENRDTLRRQTELFRGEPLLPPLDQNIKCFNSLIGTDFSLDPTELTRVNAGDWDIQFEQIMNVGGFDAVVGNPPYIPIETMTPRERVYYPAKFRELERKFDTSVAFILQALRLVKSSGTVGYISSVTWETGENYARLRQTMFQQHGVVEVVNLPFDIFDDAYVETCVYVLSGEPCTSYRMSVLPKKTKLQSLREVEFTTVPTELIAAPDFRLVLNPAAETLFRKVSRIESFVPLGEITKSTQGLAANRFHRTTVRKAGPTSFPFGESCQAYRYDFLLEETTFTDLSEMPSLQPFYGSEPKVVIRRVINRQDRLDAALVAQRLVFKKDLNPFIPTDDNFDAKALLGILNSKLISFLYINSSAIATKDDFRQTTLAELRRLPIPRLLSHLPLNGRLVALVDRMLSLTPALRAAKSDAEKATLQNALKKTDRDIDLVVYQLYGLTPDEVDLVKGSESPTPTPEAD